MSTLRFIRSTGEEATLDEATLEGFRSAFRGQVLLAEDNGYEEGRRVWNGLIDKRPAIIARATGVADVIDAVNFARENSLLLAVRGGGHNVAGNAVCDGGIVIDLSPMRGVRVDPERRTAWVQAGANWGDVDRETQAFGLATPGGVVSDTGVAGLTLGGGLGWLRRKLGLTIDNLLAVDIVTPDGRYLHASEAEDPDLFWAVRGGGGNFGVVTAFEFRLHPVGPEVMLAMTLYPADIAGEVMRFYRDWNRSAPDEVSSFAINQFVPSAEPYPLEHHGSRTVILAACYAGPVEEGERVLQPWREVGPPIADFSGPTTYRQVQISFDEDYPSGMYYYWKSLNVDDLSDAAIDTIIRLADEAPSSHSTLDLWHLGGAIGRVPPGATAFGRRDAPYLLGVEANWNEMGRAEENIAWARRCVAEMQPFSRGGSYLNFPGFYEEGTEGLRSTFATDYERLAAVKAKYDPTNLLRLNQNIKPAG